MGTPNELDDRGREVLPYTLAVPEADLEDLRARLGRTRFPEREPADGWSQGIPRAYVEELCQWWRESYDWRPVERELNAWGQWHTVIDGLDIHFLHVRSSRADARPLLVTHGWPGSVIEALDVIDGLVNPPDDQPAFHLVLPSLPGFGMSGKPTGTGWGLSRIANAWAELMARLGYDRFLAQGGDWGAMVTITLAIRHPERVAMMHTTVPWAPRPDDADDARLTEVEARDLADYAEFGRSGRGYAAEQATKPQTIGYSLVDSPAGQLAWIAEKLFEFSDSIDSPEEAISRQRMLDNISLYWLTASGASSARLYWESFSGLGMMDMSTPVEVPAAVSVFPCEIMRLPRSWVERRYPDLRHWRRLDHGGHFAMLEVPDLFVGELRDAFAHAPAL